MRVALTWIRVRQRPRSHDAASFDGDDVMTATRKLWIFLIGLLLASFTVLLWVGGEIHRVTPPIPEAVVTAERQTSVHARRHRDRAARSGSRSAACSWARSGATAATSRRTGPPTGCIAKPIAWLDVWARARDGATATRSLPAEQQAALQARAAAADPRQHLRRGDRARSRSTPIAPPAIAHGRRALREPVRQRPGDCSSCARPTR